MIHKVSEMCDMIETMYKESLELRRLKYDVPKLHRSETLIDDKISQIQYMALLVANDKQPYEKKQ